MTDAPVPGPLLLGVARATDQPGGLERYVADLHAALARVQPDALPRTVLLGRRGPGDAAAHVDAVTSIDAGVVTRVLAMARAVRADRSVRPGRRVVDTHFALLGVLATARPVRGGDRPLVVHFHGPWAAESATQADGTGAVTASQLVRRAVERSVYRRADLVITLSTAFASLVVERYGVSPWVVAVEPPGVDLERFTPGPRDDARARLGLPPDRPIVACVRRLVPRTGVDTAVEAWALLIPDPGVASAFGAIDRSTPLLVVAGDGPDRPGLEAWANRTGLAPDHIRFLGRVDDDDLPALYRAADLTIVPSRSLEGYGLVTLESLASGVPVVVTGVGGLPEAMAGMAGATVPPDAPRALADRIAAALDGSRPLPDAAACRDRAEGHRWDDVARRHLASYRSLLSPSTSARGSAALRVVALDHVARWSGGEIALARLLPHVPDARFHAVLFENGPLEGALAAAGVTSEVRALDERARDLRRSRTSRLGALIGPTLSSTRFTAALAWRLRQLRPDLVHANSLKAAVIGGFAARLTGTPLVWHLRDRITTDELPRPTVRAVHFALRHLATGVVANSATTLASVASALPDTMPRLVLPDPYSPPPLNGARAGAGAAGGSSVPTPSGHTAVRVVLLGRLAPWKGQDVFLRALAATRTAGAEADATCPPLHGALAGAALFGEDAWVDEIHHLAADLGLDEPALRWLGHVDDVPALLAATDIVVHASTTPEPFGQVVVEAMAAGVAVVATATGGPAELITDGVDGVLVAPGDHEALAAALLSLAADPERRRRLGEAGRTTAERYLPDRVAPALAAFYAEVLATRRS